VNVQHNPGQATVKKGDEGEAVKQAQRALRRTPDPALQVDGEFGPLTEAATKEFQKDAGLAVTGVVDRATWNALPSGDPMPTLSKGSTGDVVRSLQEILTKGAYGLWETIPKGIDGDFGSNTSKSVIAFQTWAGVKADGVVGQQTWDAVTLEFTVGLQYTIGVQPIATP